MTQELLRKTLERRIRELQEQEDAATDYGQDDIAIRARAMRHELEDDLAILTEEVAS